MISFLPNTSFSFTLFSDFNLTLKLAQSGSCIGKAGVGYTRGALSALVKVVANTEHKCMLNNGACNGNIRTERKQEDYKYVWAFPVGGIGLVQYVSRINSYLIYGIIEVLRTSF